MPKYHYDIEQHSDRWDAIRTGKATSSNFKKIITPQGKPSKQWEAYAYHVIAERILGRQVDTYTSPWMERGNMMESDAFAWYEFDRGCEVKRVGFVTDDSGSIGCSPDGLVGDDGLIEIKVPKPATHVEYLLTGQVEDVYRPQLQGQLYITGRKWVDIISFHPELPRKVIRVERDEVYIVCLGKLLADFNKFIDAVMEKISSQINPETANYLLAG